MVMQYIHVYIQVKPSIGNYGFIGIRLICIIVYRFPIEMWIDFIRIFFFIITVSTN